MRSNRGYANVAPLFLYQDRDGLLAGNGRQVNLSVRFREDLQAVLGIEVLDPNEILAFIYATFHSGTYRLRYSDLLKIDFPRIPLPGRLDLFRELARRGGELVALHLMESPNLDDFITTYTGPKNPEVGRVGWSDDTVWLDAGKTNAREGHRATKSGTIGFSGVPEEVWNFHIGGYQVCHKWLKDRKGRTLSQDDITHYQKIVVALTETIRLMQEIDEVIERHGGWPGAFQTGEAKAATTEVIPFRPRTVEPTPEKRYKTCVPLVPLKAAAGAFGDPQHIEDDGSEWVDVGAHHHLRPATLSLRLSANPWSLRSPTAPGAFSAPRSKARARARASSSSSATPPTPRPVSVIRSSATKARR